jgi:ATP-dependent DNA helicase RecG
VKAIHPDYPSLVKEVRRQLYVSREHLVRELGVRNATVNPWENGRTRPSPLALKQIEHLLRDLGEKEINTQDDLEVALPALEELVFNMLLHRDYFISGPWRVRMFDNRIELISPGALPNNLTVENIRNGVSNIRNPLIASYAAKKLPYRGIGTGILRALAAVPDLELESDHDRNLFTARIPRKANGQD